MGGLLENLGVNKDGKDDHKELNNALKSHDKRLLILNELKKAEDLEKTDIINLTKTSLKELAEDIDFGNKRTRMLNLTWDEAKKNSQENADIQSLFGQIWSLMKLDAKFNEKFEGLSPEDVRKGYFETAKLIIKNDKFWNWIKEHQPKTEVDPTKKTEVDPTKKTEVDPTKKTEVDPTKKTEVDPTKKTEVDPTKKTEVDPTKKTETPVINNPTTITDKPTNNKENPINDKKIERRKERAEKRLTKLNNVLKNLETAREGLLTNQKLLLDKQNELVSLEAKIKASTDEATKANYEAQQKELYKLIGNPKASNDKEKTGIIQNEIAKLEDEIDYIQTKELTKATDKMSGKYEKYTQSIDKETKDFTESKQKGREQDKNTLDKQKQDQPSLSLDPVNKLLTEREQLVSKLAQPDVADKQKIFDEIAKKNAEIGLEQGKINTSWKGYEGFANKYNDKKQGYYSDVSAIVEENLEVYVSGIEGIDAIIRSYDESIKTLEGQQATNKKSIETTNIDIQTLDKTIAAKQTASAAEQDPKKRSSMIREIAGLRIEKGSKQEQIVKFEKFGEVLEQNKQQIVDQKAKLEESPFYQGMKAKVDQLNKDDAHIDAQLQRVGFQRTRNNLMVQTNDLQRNLDAQEQDLRHLKSFKAFLETKQQETEVAMSTGSVEDQTRAAKEYEQYSQQLDEFEKNNNLEEKQQKIDDTKKDIADKRKQVADIEKQINELTIPEAGGFVPMVQFQDYLVEPYGLNVNPVEEKKENAPVFNPQQRNKVINPRNQQPPSQEKPVKIPYNPNYNPDKK